MMKADWTANCSGEYADFVNPKMKITTKNGKRMDIIKARKKRNERFVFFNVVDRNKLSFKVLFFCISVRKKGIDKEKPKAKKKNMPSTNCTIPATGDFPK